MKSRVVFLIKVIILLCFITGIPKQVCALEPISIDEGDYELLCTYNDGSKLTISKDDVYFSNNTLSVTDNIGLKKSFYVLNEQKNNYQNITSSGKCPLELFAYKVDAKYDENNDIKGTSTIYYSTLQNKNIEIGGGTHNTFLFWGEEPNATMEEKENLTLVSEQVSLLSSKETVICDYKTKAESSITSSRSMSIFLYSNLTIAEVDGYFTTLEGEIWTTCKGSKNGMHVNNPTPQKIIGNIDDRADYKRLFLGGENACKDHNNKNDCTFYEYLGSRNGNTEDFVESTKVCEVLGGETVEQLRRIINILQILVPVLTIALTAFDLIKIVLSGNLEEELPKKKKVITIRLVIMAFFFFLPFITSLLLGMLKDAGVIGVEQIDCITKEG